MRYAGRLLPALQAVGRSSAASTQAAARRASASSAAAAPAVDASVLAATLATLRRGVQFELDKGCSNYKGSTAMFDEFLVSQLAAVEPQVPHLVRTYMSQAQAYGQLSPERRSLLCLELLEGLDGVGTGGAAVTQQAQPPPTSGAVQTAGQAAPLRVEGDAENAGLVAGAPAAEPALMAAFEASMQEWALSHAEQLDRPFTRPDPAALRFPVPVIFDLETTGLGKSAHIVELGALQPMSGAEFVSRVRLAPGCAMHPGAAAATGITTEDALLPEHPEFDPVYRSFFSILRDEVAAAGPGGYLLLIGHNIMKFDLLCLTHRAAEAGLPTLRHARFLDTLVLAQAAFRDVGAPGQPPNYKQPSLYEHFAGQTPVGAHRALADCRANEVVLRGLLPLIEELPGTAFAERLHAAATMPGVSWCGWVGDVVAADGQAPQQSKRQARKRAPKPGSTCSLVDSLARADSGSSSGALDLQAPAVSSVDADVAAWLGPDPLARVEGGGAAALEGGEEGAAPAAPLSLEEKRAHVAAVQAGWQAILQDPALRSSLMSTPIAQLKKRGAGGFTDKQQRDLESGRVTTLGQLLECYPSRLMASQPGRLPEEGDEDPVVTLAARWRRPPVVRQSGGGSAWFLKAELEVVHPSQAGLAVPWLPRDAYEGRECRLQIFDYRRGRWALHPLRLLKEKLEAAGEVVVVSGPVKPLPLDAHTGPDTWRLDAAKLSVLLPEEACAAFGQAGSGSAQLTVVHPSRGDVTPTQMRLLVDKALGIAQDAVDRGADAEPLPSWALEQYKLMPMLPALRAMHRPASEAELEEARQRLAFQELLALQLKLLVQRNLAWGGTAEAGGGGGAVRIDGRSSQLLELGKDSLGFELTEGQTAALDDILGQMADWPPMQCLLQGDVGCGKTAVAFLALLAAAGAGYQGAIMAPTEILAEQHYRGLERLVQRMNREVSRRRLDGFRLPRIALLTGSVKGKARSVLNAALARGDIEIAVGTHALISDSTQFSRLGLAVVDEQHKFGVEQRGRLLAKASPAPHVLHMTATPIPRTQALIDHGDMSQVIITELPAGRSPVRTLALEDGSAQRVQMYEHIRREMAAGHCVYIVCPFVEESDKLAEVKAATAEAERLVAEGVFDAGDCGLLHGQMSPEEKDAVLARFKAGEVKVLVSTTVVEVGVDVPQATVMVIEHAERFGFAQLHQLRGRVGRSERQSYCYLVYSKGSGATARKKMQVLVNCSNGFAVAECDLELRGAGEVLGKRQSGRDVRTTFKAARIPGDREVLEQAREAAARLLARHPDPRDWPPELRALVADEGLLQLDTLSMPSLAAA